MKKYVNNYRRMVFFIFLLIFIGVLLGSHILNNFKADNKFESNDENYFDPFYLGWKSVKQINIDSKQFSITQNNYSILLSIVDSNLKNQTLLDGSDIIFMNDLGVSEILDYKIEYFHKQSGNLIAKVNLPSQHNSSNTDIYMYYNNPNIDSSKDILIERDPQSFKDSDYLKVYHISDSNDSNEELDQYMVLVDGGRPIGNYTNSTVSYYWTVAQSFKPRKLILTRLEIFISKNDIQPTIYPLKISLRNKIDGEDIRSTSINTENISDFPKGVYLEFDFDDLKINVGDTYYIVCKTESYAGNMYFWGANSKNLYQDGQVLYSINDGENWDSNPQIENVDMCFRTFGKDD
jgi:hypothetical protein